MPSSGMLRRVALVRTEVSEELSAYIIRVTRIGELETLAVTSNRRTLRRTTRLLEYTNKRELMHFSSLNPNLAVSRKRALTSSRR
jgi:hypothetical protein